MHAIIAMGASLNLKVIAEGVEREAQARFLRENGCEVTQGFLFSHPLSGAELTEMLGGRRLASA